MIELARVLLVDDDPIVLNLFVAVLGNKFSTVKVESGEEAVRALDRQLFDAVLTDHRMPGMSGLEFLGIMAVRFPEVTGVLLTGAHDDPGLIAAQKAAKFTLLFKPVENKTLIAWTQNAVARTRAARITKEIRDGR